jgi:hypothetical protein
MAWTPTESLLTTTDELKNLSFSISYVDDSTGDPAIVNVTQIDANPTIQVSANNISGYFSDSFDYEVNYIDNKGTDYTVSRFSEIDQDKLYELYKYSPNTTNNITYNYVATATDSITNEVLASQPYSIVVTQNWTSGKNQLLRYINNDNYDANYVVVLRNSSGDIVSTLNNTGNPVYLERS